MQSDAKQTPAPDGPIDPPRLWRWKILVFAGAIIVLAFAARLVFWLPDEYHLAALAVIIFSACHVSFMMFARPNGSDSSPESGE